MTRKTYHTERTPFIVFTCCLIGVLYAFPQTALADSEANVIRSISPSSSVSNIQNDLEDASVLPTPEADKTPGVEIPNTQDPENAAEDRDVAFVAYQLRSQEPTSSSTLSESRARPSFGQSQNRGMAALLAMSVPVDRSTRLAAAPPIFGDYQAPFPIVSFYAGGIPNGGDPGGNPPPHPHLPGAPTIDSSAMTARAGGTQYIKIADNYMVMPANRIYVSYHHYNIGTPSAPGFPPPAIPSLELDRMTLGLEKMFGNDQNSIEVRLPFYSIAATMQPGSGIQYELNDPRFGNMSFVYKRVLWCGDTSIGCFGLATGAPTAEDFLGSFGSMNFRIRNEAVHMTPFFGVARAQGRRFWTGVIQVDAPLNGNRIEYSQEVAIPPGPGGGALIGALANDLFHDQTLLTLSWSGGFWIYQSSNDDVFLRRLAPIIEFHYTKPLQDASIVGTSGVPSMGYTPPIAKADQCNFTAGFHALIGEQGVLRIGGAIPLGNDFHRSFDAEFLTSFEWRR